jgi:Fe2+ or Zn2+ uptake regulation protein
VAPRQRIAALTALVPLIRTVRRSLDRFQKSAHIGAVSSTDYTELLRSADLRVTRPRLAVLEAVNVRPHADTETIFSAVRIGLPDVSRQAVYDVLNALTAVGLVRRIQPSGLVARYESRVGDNHHHLVCRSCGVIADIDCAVGEAPCLTPLDENNVLGGFVLDEAEVVYWGLCPDCSNAVS